MYGPHPTPQAPPPAPLPQVPYASHGSGGRAAAHHQPSNACPDPMCRPAWACRHSGPCPVSQRKGSHGRAATLGGGTASGGAPAARSGRHRAWRISRAVARAAPLQQAIRARRRRRWRRRPFPSHLPYYPLTTTLPAVPSPPPPASGSRPLPARRPRASVPAGGTGNATTDTAHTTASAQHGRAPRHPSPSTSPCHPDTCGWRLRGHEAAERSVPARAARRPPGRRHTAAATPPNATPPAR